MKLSKLNKVLEFTGNTLDMYDEIPDVIAHDIAHSLWLYDRVSVDCSGFIDNDISKMSVTRSNDQEMKTVALHLAGVRALKCPQARVMMRESFDNLAFGSIKYRTFEQYRTAIATFRVPDRLIKKFVKIIRDF